MRLLLTLFACLVAARSLFAAPPNLKLPPRSPTAIGGEAFANQIAGLPPQEREQRIWAEVVSGNVPDFLRRFVAVPVAGKSGGTGTVFVAPDYLAVGSNDDYFFVPMTPYTAQKIADRVGCLLPTPKIVNAIYLAAEVKLTPSPIPPTPAMTTVSVFLTHNRTVAAQRAAFVAQYPLGALTAGDKKDIVICKALADTPGHVAIYGWHRPDGKPIQPLYLGHFAYWADYSHGVRLVDRTMEIGGKKMSLERVLRDPQLCDLVSDEGPVLSPRYRIVAFPQPDDPTIHPLPGERIETFSPVPGVRVLLDEPTPLQTKVRLVLYALPNGNTIEQTFGRKLRPGDDWHYDIQHIGAQTRFLRKLEGNESLVVAYLEAANHAWPSWLRSHPDFDPVQLVASIADRYQDHDVRLTLDSHSGGGAFIFAYLDRVEHIPAQIDRIAFLDSEYNYEAAGHEAKLAEWLRGDNRYLCAIAYDDASARLDGKPFVSAEGGTWGRTHAMLTDLGRDFKIERVGDSDPERYEGLGGRICFLLKENPKAQIFHTVQVERNGFIESLLSGTPDDGKGYLYFGRRAYSSLIGR